MAKDQTKITTIELALQNNPEMRTAPRPAKLNINLNNREYQDHEIHGPGAIRNGRFAECQFVVSEGSLRLHECSLERVEFRADNSAERPGLELTNCRIEVAVFYGNWGTVVVRGGEPVFVNLQRSMEVRSLRVENCELVTSDIRCCLNRWHSENAVLVDAVWKPRELTEATLTNTAFVRTYVDVQVLFNSCWDLSSVNLQRAKLRDKWLELRDDYTGPRLFIVLVLTVAFIAPYFARSIYYIALSKVSESMTNTSMLLERLLLGSHSGIIAYAYCLLGVLLVYYNCIRFFLTVKMSKLREREEHWRLYGITRAFPDTNSYSWYWRLHLVQRKLVYVIYGAAVWRVGEVLFLQVPSLR